MRKTTILITDDEPNIRLVLRTALESTGYAVVEAADGRQAIDQLNDRDGLGPLPDLLLLDLSMPVLDGMGVLRVLKDRPAGRRPPVVVLTAYGSIAKAVEAMRLGARDFLEKPVTPDDLRAAVAGALRDRGPLDAWTASEAGAAGDAPPAGYDQTLAAVRAALREAQFPDAESLLMRAGSIAPDHDAAFLNLAGVFHEAMGRPDAAKRFYGRAIHSDPAYEPAQQNMRRLYELGKFGHTHETVALGDEPALVGAAAGVGGQGLGADLAARLRRLVGRE